MRRTLLAAALATGAMAAPAGQEKTTAPRVIHVVAERFNFTPSTITVDQGTSVELRITSDDTDHGFKLVGLGDDIDIEIPKRGRGEAKVTFEATEPGSYKFECSRICGAGHGFMHGTVRVRPRPESR